MVVYAADDQHPGGEDAVAGGGPTAEQVLASGIAKHIFRLNGQLVEMAEDLARPAGLTAAWWRVLGGVVDQPLSVAEIARRFGITRQSVQPVADLLVDEGLAEFRPNPAHRRAKLVAVTADGRAALRRIGPGHRAFADRLADDLGHDRLMRLLGDLEAYSKAVDHAAAAVRSDAREDADAG